MKNSKWIAYNKLAWTDMIIDSPGSCDDEVQYYIQLLKKHTNKSSGTLLHFGCGAGMHDYSFKKYFQITGVDLSKGMLELAKKLNPEIRYIHGDMRTIHLSQKFDVVIIPDSIGYMTTEDDLEKAISTACSYLENEGVLLITAQTRKDFKENNFVYTGVKDGIHLTIFENNHIPAGSDSTYEAVLTYLIRQKGNLEIYNECHTIGLFSRNIWRSLFQELNLSVTEYKINDLYDPYIMNEGNYIQTIFICKKHNKTNSL